MTSTVHPAGAAGDNSGVAGEALSRFLGSQATTLLRQAAAHAAKLSMPLYLVGGAVRDLLLGLPGAQLDLDLVVVGDAVALAEDLAVALGGAAQTHPEFGTATLQVGAFVLDLVTARAESYARPGALPDVRPASLRDDLLRRDFTVNTLALDLGQASYGRLTDLCDGVADLRCGLLRVLHDRSFLDDPTRILRGARLAARLGLTLEPHTAALLAAALAQNAFATVTPQRLLGEICLALHEPAPEHILAALAAWGALAALHPALHHTPQLERQLARARNAAFPAVDPADVALALITYDLSPAAREDLIARYQPQGSHMRLLRDITKAREQVELLRAGAVANSVVDRVLRGIGEVALRAAQIVEPEPAAELIARYLDELRGVQIAVDGVFLKQMGLAPGPCYRELLEGLRAAVLDGIVTTKEEQEGWLRMRLSVER